MIRATTPKHSFIFEQDPSLFSRILITYVQGDTIVLEKEKSDLTIEQKTNPKCGAIEWVAWLRLTQEETKKFKATPGAQVKIQVRVLTNEGEALASDKKSISVQDVLNDEVLI